MNKELEEQKKVRKLERLTKDLTPEGWRLLSAQMDTYSEDFMRKYADRLAWQFLSIGSRLTESFMREMEDYVDWSNVSTWGKLSENFMRQNADKLNWIHISRYQKFSWDFIIEFHKKINFGMLCNNENINQDIWKKCREKNYIGDGY